VQLNRPADFSSPDLTGESYGYFYLMLCLAEDHRMSMLRHHVFAITAVNKTDSWPSDLHQASSIQFSATTAFQHD
jgi:hypothetical protein